MDEKKWGKKEVQNKGLLTERFLKHTRLSNKEYIHVVGGVIIIVAIAWVFAPLIIVVWLGENHH